LPKGGGVLFCNTFVAMKQTLTIDGENFSDLEGFYHEIDRVLTKDTDWKTGHNLDALNDLLRGGFGVFEYEEPIGLVWKNYAKSLQELGEEKVGELTEIIGTHKHIEFFVLLFS
jgi:RNAse (barnase) inhibitor barstar